MLAITPVPDVVEELARCTPCRIQKASLDGGGRLTLELYLHDVAGAGEGRKAWLVIDRGTLALVNDKPARAGDGPPPAAQRLVREELVPGGLLQVSAAGPLVRFTCQTSATARARLLIVERTGDARLVLCAASAPDSDEQPRVLAVFGGARAADGRDLRRGKPYREPVDPAPFLEGAPAPAASMSTDRAPLVALTALRAALRAESKRLKRLVDALEGDLVRHGDAAAHELCGELCKTVLGKIARGSASIDVVDWHGQARTLLLDPAKDARHNLEEFFKRARRARAAAARTAPRLHEAKARLSALEEARRALAPSPGNQLADEHVLAQARALLTREDVGGSARRKAAKQGRRQPWRSFRCTGDVVVRLGRGAKDNDLLLKSARGNDVWLHARNHQGAHVVVPSSGADVAAELMLDAAHLAAHFSSARGEARVDVQHARVKHVKKPGPGAPAGLVHITHEGVLHLRVESTRIRGEVERLLARLVKRVKRCMTRYFEGRSDDDALDAMDALAAALKDGVMIETIGNGYGYG